MSYIILRGHWCHIIVLKVYAPAEVKIGQVKYNFSEELERVFDEVLKDHMKYLVRDFNAKVGREDIFKSTIENQSSQEVSNDNGVRVVNFPASKILTAKSIIFLCSNINKFAWTSPDGKTHNQIDHILISDAVQMYLMSVHSGQRFIIKKLNEAEGNEKYRVEILYRFADLEYFDAEVDINSSLATLVQNINMSAKECIGYYELKEHKP
jgi:hypothetical protein